MNRWREKNEDENFENNSNANTAFKNTHKHKSGELIVINSTMIFYEGKGVGDKWWERQD